MTYTTDTTEEIKEPVQRLSLSESEPLLQVAWDSTSLGALKSCPRLYELMILRGYSSSGESVHLKFGIHFHAATEIYDHELAAHGDHDKAVIAALRYCIMATWDDENNRPWESDEPTKTRKTLIRTVVWYLDYHKDDSLKTVILENGLPSTEVSFRFDLNDLVDDNSFVSFTDENYQLCGHLDKAVEWNEELWIVDKKTTKAYLNDNYFAHYNPDNQVSAYAIAGLVIFRRDIAGVIIDAIQILVNGSRFQRRPIPRTLGQLEEWLHDLRILIKQNETYVKNNYWPTNDKFCGMYGGCQFRAVCGSDPSIRQQILDSFYVKRIWDPLQPR